MLTNSEKYRKAAETCRRTAKRSSTPAEWLRFAAGWDKMAERADRLTAWEVDRERRSFIESALQAIGGRTIH